MDDRVESESHSQLPVLSDFTIHQHPLPRMIRAGDQTPGSKKTFPSRFPSLLESLRASVFSLSPPYLGTLTLSV